MSVAALILCTVWMRAIHVGALVYPLTRPTKSSSLSMSGNPLSSARLDKARAFLDELEVDSSKLSPNPTVVTDTPQIPETFWKNGHLDEAYPEESSYVTRWARGVKVAEPLIRYDPVAAEKRLFRRPTAWLVRNVQIALPLLDWSVSVTADIFLGVERQNRKIRARQLLLTITRLGPAIIKAGQALSSRPDLLPAEYLLELQKLQDDVPVFSNARAFGIVESELGRKFGDVFELVQEEPVAAASIGQVYKARLVSNRDNIVAIKIQRPDCEEIVALDLYILRWWGDKFWNVFAKVIGKDIDFAGIIDDFGVLIYRELDYVAEAANAQRFSELYGVSGGNEESVFVPRVYSDLTTGKVLTMEWVDGCSLTDERAMSKYDIDSTALLNTLIQVSLRQILENGFFHADPHGGNLLATPDGRLCYLDFGMMSYANVQQRNGFLLAVVHIVNRDWVSLVELYQKLGFIPLNTDTRPIREALENALPNVLDADVKELNFKNVISKLGDIMYAYQFSLPPFYISIIRCLGVLEGLAIQVDPETRVISQAYPYIASRVLTDPQDDLTEALKRLALNEDGKSIRWDRLENLLEKAQGTNRYDVTQALDRLSDYLISENGADILEEIADRLVQAADQLGGETVGYVLKASQALIVRDEVEAVRAVRGLQKIIDQAQNPQEQEVWKEVMPNLTPSMKRFLRVASLLGGAASNNKQSTSDMAKWVPILRKLAQEPRIQLILLDITARLGERVLSRTLRASFGLPPPKFSGSLDKRIRV